MLKRNLKYLGMLLYAYTLNATAVAPGFFMGIMGGPASNSGSTLNAAVTLPDGTMSTVPATPKSTLAAGRLFLGYKFVQWFSTELGVTAFSTINYDAGGANTCSNTQVWVDSGDITLKGNLPIQWFEIFLRAGLSINYVNRSSSLNAQDYCLKGFHEYTFGPYFSLGASVDLTQNWVLEASYNRTSSGSPINNITWAAIGISYHIVDVFCGQFLCDD